MRAIAPQPFDRLVYHLCGEPILFLRKVVCVSQKLRHPAAPDRVIVLVDVVFQVPPGWMRHPRIVFLASQPVVCVKSTVEVHSRGPVVVAIGDQPANVTLGAQDVGNRNILCGQRLPGSIGQCALAGK